MNPRPFIVGLGGTTRANSSSERVLQACLAQLEARGARVQAFCGQALVLPMYEPDASVREAQAESLVASVRACDGVLMVSPGYHGSISGLLKNALDYLEDLRDDERPYLHGRSVGCIGCAYGWQAANSTLGALRTIAHALRGWPTPFGAAVNTAAECFQASSGAPVPDLDRQLATIADQVMEFARMRAGQ
jgi:FMN reductase